jgi:capsular polysaccharide biosynthesis protein
MFQGAEAVASSHGSGLANLVFSQPGTKVIEFQPRKLQDVYFRLCRRMGLDYCYLKSTTGPENPVNNKQQIRVDLQDLQRTLKMCGL